LDQQQPLRARQGCSGGCRSRWRRSSRSRCVPDLRQLVRARWYRRRAEASGGSWFGAATRWICRSRRRAGTSATGRACWPVESVRHLSDQPGWDAV
jgi:hypothetical protein